MPQQKFQKGSQEAKEFMAKLRGMRGNGLTFTKPKKSTVVATNAPLAEQKERSNARLAEQALSDAGYNSVSVGPRREKSGKRSGLLGVPTGTEQGRGLARNVVVHHIVHHSSGGGFWDWIENAASSVGDALSSGAKAVAKDVLPGAGATAGAALGSLLGPEGAPLGVIAGSAAGQSLANGMGIGLKGRRGRRPKQLL